MGQWGNAAMGQRGNEAMGQWGNGAMGDIAVNATVPRRQVRSFCNAPVCVLG
jgi:hypothetical protein